MAQNVEKNELLRRVKTAVQTVTPAAEIILFGSHAKGTADAESDWDFLILLPASRDRMLETEIKDNLYTLELETDTVLSSLIRSKKEWLSPQYAVLPFKQEIERDGIRL